MIGQAFTRQRTNLIWISKRRKRKLVWTMKKNFNSRLLIYFIAFLLNFIYSIFCDLDSSSSLPFLNIRFFFFTALSNLFYFLDNGVFCMQSNEKPAKFLFFQKDFLKARLLPYDICLYKMDCIHDLLWHFRLSN